jgi:putative ABC transport system permease protein
MVLTLSQVAFIFALTVAMCILSGSIALRRVLAADPAEVFR